MFYWFSLIGFFAVFYFIGLFVGLVAGVRRGRREAVTEICNGITRINEDVMTQLSERLGQYVATKLDIVAKQIVEANTPSDKEWLN